MYILVNGIHLYYNVYGRGKPIILLHGNRGSSNTFDKLIESLKKNYTVYAIDSRCQGKSEDSNTITYEMMCSDVICFIEQLNIHKPILYGFSDGGIVGLLVAIKRPKLLKKLIVSGPNLYPKGFKISMLLYSFFGYIKTHNKLFRLMYKEPHISIEDLHKIEVPTVIIVGEKDIVKESHTREIADNIDNCQLEILDHENHSSYVVHSDKLYGIIKKYL